jgi:hypothetical protein
VKEWNYSEMVSRHYSETKLQDVLCNQVVAMHIFASVISLDSFESICRLLHFTDNSSKAKCEVAQNHSKLTFI